MIDLCDQNKVEASGIVPRLDDLNSKSTEANNSLELLCKQRSIPFISHCKTIYLKKHLSESNLHLDYYVTRVFAENYSNFLLKSNWQHKVNPENKELNRLWYVSPNIQYLFGNYLSSLPINKKCISFYLFCLLLNCMPELIFSEESTLTCISSTNI